MMNTSMAINPRNNIHMCAKSRELPYYLQSCCCSYIMKRDINMAEFTLHARVVSTHVGEKGWSVRGINEIGWYRESEWMEDG